MKLVSFNIWCGRMFQPLVEFISRQSQDTDIFCLQEVFSSPVEHHKDGIMRANMLQELEKALPEFQPFFLPDSRGIDFDTEPVNFDLEFGKAIFVRGTIPVISAHNHILYKSAEPVKKDWSNNDISLQQIGISANGKKFTIFNYHGAPQPGSKLDTMSRIEHSAKIKKITKDVDGAKILVGDFNLLPETQSIRMLEDGMRNLIKEFRITSTRSRLNRFNGRPGDQKFADYAFVTDDVMVKGFQTPEVEVSDHLPLLLEFS